MALSKRIVSHLTPDAAAVLDFLKGKPGSERGVLERIAEATLNGQEVSADLQKIANALLAKALLDEKLPTKAPGRPRDEQAELKRVEYAYRYFELFDKDVRHAAQKVSEKFHREVRQVHRDQKKYRWLIGWCEEYRDRFRAWRAGIDEETYKATILMNLRQRESLPVINQPSLHARQRKSRALLESLREELSESMKPLDGDVPEAARD